MNTGIQKECNSGVFTTVTLIALLAAHHHYATAQGGMVSANIRASQPSNASKSALLSAESEPPVAVEASSTNLVARSVLER